MWDWIIGGALGFVAAVIVLGNDALNVPGVF